MLAGTGVASFAQSGGETRMPPGQRDSMKGGAGGSTMDNTTNSGSSRGQMNDNTGTMGGNTDTSGTGTTGATDGLRRRQYEPRATHPG